MKAASMSLDAVLAQLEAWGSEGARKLFERHGAGTQQFGVPLGKLRGLARKLAINHELALELWATGNADARILATMLFAPDRLTRAELERMVKPITYFRLIDELIYNAVAKSPCADELRERWIGSPKEFIGRAGWDLLNARIVAGRTDGLDLAAILATIEAEILAAPKRKQEAMNCCLVEIGTRIPSFTKKCIALGERLGRFDKRPVPKGCVSTYAPEWIAAVLARKK